jgi:hypothetical protein
MKLTRISSQLLSRGSGVTNTPPRITSHISVGRDQETMSLSQLSPTQPNAMLGLPLSRHHSTPTVPPPQLQ